MSQAIENPSNVHRIHAIPTVYRGRRYRSRLEARWAAFFDLLGWRHEYEPLDLKGWIPDFLLHGLYCKGQTRNVLAEIKPITEWDGETAAKILAAAAGEYDLLLLGVSPFLLHEQALPGVQLGWIVDTDEGELRVVDNRAIFKCFASENGTLLDFADESYAIGGYITSLMSLYYEHQRTYYRADLLESSQARGVSTAIMEIWAEATNLVQWKPARSRP